MSEPEKSSDHECEDTETDQNDVCQEDPNYWQDHPDEQHEQVLQEQQIVSKSEPPKRFFSNNKYTLQEKRVLAAFVFACKKHFDEKGPTKKWDQKKRKIVETNPSVGFVSKAVREYYSDMKTKKSTDPEFLKAKSYARRCFETYGDAESLDDLASREEPAKKRFRAEGAGRKPQAPEFRDQLFEWFIDVRTGLKGRLPKKIFVTKAQELYHAWLNRQPEKIPEENQLKFQNNWIYKWMEEYHVSLQMPNKRFSIKQDDRIDRIQEYLKNVWRIRHFMIQKYGVDPPLINGDQMPIHR